jgi:hypothetical protein
MRKLITNGRAFGFAITGALQLRSERVVVVFQPGRFSDQALIFGAQLVCYGAGGFATRATAR